MTPFLFSCSFVDVFQKVVCEHEIGNIFCVCQDGDHMNYFAYITKDLDSAKHYCHVFNVRSTVSKYNSLSCLYINIIIMA